MDLRRIPAPPTIPEGTSPFIADGIRRARLEEEQGRVLAEVAREMGTNVRGLLIRKAHAKRLERAARIRARRRARLRNVEFERCDRSEIIRRDRRTCYLCGRGPLKLDEIHLDHKIPISRGGSHTRDNLAVACATCNVRKGALTAAEYRATLRS